MFPALAHKYRCDVKKLYEDFARLIDRGLITNLPKTLSKEQQLVKDFTERDLRLKDKENTKE